MICRVTCSIDSPILSPMKELIYGLHAVKALLEHHPDVVTQLIVQDNRQDTALEACLALAYQAGVHVEYRPRKVIDQQFKTPVVHQGVVAECHVLPGYTEKELPGILAATTSPKLILILDGVQDPHNLGACLRTANAMGCCCVIAPKDRTASLTSTAIKVSTGAAFATPFVPVSNLARTMRLCQEQGIWTVGLTADTEMMLKDVDLTGDVAIVMGAEGQGLRALTEKHCDYLAKIPMSGSVASLNVSVATGMALYEVRR